MLFRGALSLSRRAFEKNLMHAYFRYTLSSIDLFRPVRSLIVQNTVCS